MHEDDRDRFADGGKLESQGIRFGEYFYPFLHGINEHGSERTWSIEPGGTGFLSALFNLNGVGSVRVELKERERPP